MKICAYAAQIVAIHTKCLGSYLRERREGPQKQPPRKRFATSLRKLPPPNCSATTLQRSGAERFYTYNRARNQDLLSLGVKYLIISVSRFLARFHATRSETSHTPRHVPVTEQIHSARNGRARQRKKARYSNEFTVLILYTTTNKRTMLHNVTQYYIGNKSISAILRKYSQKGQFSSSKRENP